MKSNVWKWCESWSEEWCDYFWYRAETDAAGDASVSMDEHPSPIWFGVHIKQEKGSGRIFEVSRPEITRPSLSDIHNSHNDQMFA